MPCPHFDVKVIQRSKRQSAVASAAYQSGERLFSEYDQKQKYYSHKSEIVHTEIMLPPHAPPEYADRNTLWNAAEAIEKQWNSQLARRFVLAMGYFNKNSIGNITAIVTTTLGDVENSAARVLVSVLGGFFNSVALVIVLLVFDWRIGLVAVAGVLIYLASSKMMIGASFSMARAMEIRCFSPPDKVPPPSPITVS